MKKPDVIPGQLSIFDSPFKEILAGGVLSDYTKRRDRNDEPKANQTKEA